MYAYENGERFKGIGDWLMGPTNYQGRNRNHSHFLLRNNMRMVTFFLEVTPNSHSFK